ncbi:uncharacterized protein LOC120353973 isoform X2 [Nilaparvata lugens]|nr:uncharacterized protein LOC120353973 isoform X2 [Nilaparvata lugens]XP_039295532.1 uncharacterized protein LOC120353973 isoform X2 [Nilaparvata lugens]
MVQWWALIATSAMVVATAAGNVLVCLAITWERRLQNMTNYFLMSLAITDLMVAILVMPLGILTLVIGSFPLEPVYCLVWISLDVLFCTASIMHLCTISVDRYLSLRYPMKFGRNKTRRRVVLKIAFVWLLSIAMCLPLSLQYSKDYNQVLVKGVCQIPDPVYKLIGSIVSFYIPLGVMLITFALTVHLLAKQQQSLGDTNCQWLSTPPMERDTARRATWRRFLPRSGDRAPRTQPAAGGLVVSAQNAPHHHSSAETEMSALDTHDLWLQDNEPPPPSAMSALHQFGAELLKLSRGLESLPVPVDRSLNAEDDHHVTSSPRPEDVKDEKNTLNLLTSGSSPSLRPPHPPPPPPQPHGTSSHSLRLVRKGACRRRTRASTIHVDTPQRNSLKRTSIEIRKRVTSYHGPSNRWGTSDSSSPEDAKDKEEDENPENSTPPNPKTIEYKRFDNQNSKNNLPRRRYSHPLNVPLAGYSHSRKCSRCRKHVKTDQTGTTNPKTCRNQTSGSVKNCKCYKQSCPGSKRGGSNSRDPTDCKICTKCCRGSEIGGVSYSENSIDLKIGVGYGKREKDDSEDPKSGDKDSMSSKSRGKDSTFPKSRENDSVSPEVCTRSSVKDICVECESGEKDSTIPKSSDKDRSLRVCTRSSVKDCKDLSKDSQEVYRRDRLSPKQSSKKCSSTKTIAKDSQGSSKDCTVFKSDKNGEKSGDNTCHVCKKVTTSEEVCSCPYLESLSSEERIRKDLKVLKIDSKDCKSGGLDENVPHSVHSNTEKSHNIPTDTEIPQNLPSSVNPCCDTHQYDLINLSDSDERVISGNIATNVNMPQIDSSSFEKHSIMRTSDLKDSEASQSSSSIIQISKNVSQNSDKCRHVCLEQDITVIKNEDQGSGSVPKIVGNVPKFSSKAINCTCECGCHTMNEDLSGENFPASTRISLKGRCICTSLSNRDLRKRDVLRKSEENLKVSELEPGMCECHSRMSQDITRLSENIPRTPQDVTRLSENIPRTPQDVTRLSENISSTSQDVTRLSENISRASQDTTRLSENISRTPQDVTRLSENISRTPQDVTRLSENVPRTSQDDTRLSECIPRTSGDTTRLSDNIPRTSQDSIRLSDNIPRTSGDTTRLSENIPRTSQVPSPNHIPPASKCASNHQNLDNSGFLSGDNLRMAYSCGDIRHMCCSDDLEQMSSDDFCVKNVNISKKLPSPHEKRDAERHSMMLLPPPCRCPYFGDVEGERKVSPNRTNEVVIVTSTPPQKSPLRRRSKQYSLKTSESEDNTASTASTPLHFTPRSGRTSSTITLGSVKRKSECEPAAVTTVVTWESPGVFGHRRGSSFGSAGTARTMVMTSETRSNRFNNLRRAVTLKMPKHNGSIFAATELSRVSSTSTLTSKNSKIRGPYSRNSSILFRTSSRHGRIIRLEQKATKVLGVVFFTFVILWAPFFILNLLPSICGDCEKDIGKGVFDFATWLGYASSMVNPIFYTIFNKVFRQAFKKVLLCKYHRKETWKPSKPNK